MYKAWHDEEYGFMLTSIDLKDLGIAWVEARGWLDPERPPVVRLQRDRKSGKAYYEMPTFTVDAINPLPLCNTESLDPVVIDCMKRWIVKNYVTLRRHWEEKIGSHDLVTDLYGPVEQNEQTEEDLRKNLHYIECEIKNIVGVDPFEFYMNNHEDVVYEKMNELLSQRADCLNRLFRCTPEDVKRIEQVNETLLELCNSLLKRTGRLYRSTVAERISDVAQRWFLLEPLLFAAYCTHSTVESTDLMVPMRCGKGKIEYNPNLLKDVADTELADRLKVEVMRILLKHPYQRQPYRARPEILYLASNLTILDSMGGPKAFCYDVVPRELWDKMPRNKTFEEYYGLLNRMFPPQMVEMQLSLSIEINLQGGGDSGSGDGSGGGDSGSGSGGNGDGSGSNGNKDGKDGKDGSKGAFGVDFRLMVEGAAMWEEDGIMVVDINLRITATLAGGKGRGTLPGSFIETVKASLVAPINVANLLKGFKKSILSQHRNLTRMRPSRRYGFEQMGSRYAYITKVLVAIDVSGSVDSFMLGYMLGMINQIFKQGIAAIDVVQFDAELKLPVQPLSKAIKTFKVLGRGGTDFQPVTDYYLDHREYDGLIFITDGIAPDPVLPDEARYTRPVVWIITDDDLVPTIIQGWKRDRG